MKQSLYEKYTGYIWGVVIALLSTLLAPAGLIAPAQASGAEYSVSGQRLAFDQGFVYRVATPTASPQDFSDASGQYSGNDVDLGAALKPGDYIDYLSVSSVSGVQIDARLTIKEVVNFNSGDQRPLFDPRTVSSDSPGYIEVVDEGKNSNSRDKSIHTEFETENVSGSAAYVQYEIAFFTGLGDVSQSPASVSLKNLALTIYDIDAGQFADISSFSDFYVTSTSKLTRSVNGQFTRFAEIAGSSSQNVTEEQNEYRVTVEFKNPVHSILINLGQLEADGDGGSFELNFDLATSDWSGTPPVAQESPVIAASRPPVQAPRNVPYEGPLNLRHSGTAICSGGDATITGLRLDTIKEVTVAGKPTTFEMLADGNLKYSLKDVAAGKHQVKFWVPINGLYLTDQITVGTCSTTPAVTTPGAFSASKLFANYRGDRGPVIARDRAAITAFINQYKGITTVRCVGSTSGVPAKRTDPALARARAKNACDIVKTLVPNATYTLETSTGKGVGQRFRSVTVFISGTN